MENQAKKLPLSDLIVDSFVTELSDSLVFTIKGGGAALPTEYNTCGRDCVPPTANCTTDC